MVMLLSFINHPAVNKVINYCFRRLTLVPHAGHGGDKHMPKSFENKRKKL